MKARQPSNECVALSVCIRQVYGFEPACRMIEAGVGIGILPESSALRYQNTMRLNTVELKDGWATRERSVIVREFESLPESSKSLIREIRNHHNYKEEKA